MKKLTLASFTVPAKAFFAVKTMYEFVHTTQRAIRPLHFGSAIKPNTDSVKLRKFVAALRATALHKIKTYKANELV